MRWRSSCAAVWLQVAPLVSSRVWLQVSVKLPPGSVAPKLVDSRLGTFAQPPSRHGGGGGAAALQASFSSGKAVVVATGAEATTPEVRSVARCQVPDEVCVL